METKTDLFSNLKAEDRFKALQEMASSTTKEKVRRYYTPDETAQHKDFISAEGIKLMDVKKEFADISKEFRTTIKSYDEQIKDALQSVKRGYSENEETVFEIPDHTADMMDVHDVKGKFLYSRKMHPEERQTRVIDMPKTGTNN